MIKQSKQLQIRQDDLINRLNKVLSKRYRRHLREVINIESELTKLETY
jgi:hypothetical protein